MGSDLYRFTVVDIDNASLSLSVQQLHPMDTMPAVENFAFHVVLDAFEETPTAHHPWLAKLPGWQVLLLGERTVLTKQDYEAQSIAFAEGQLPGVSSIGVDLVGDVPVYSKRARPNHRAFFRAANNEISAVSFEPTGDRTGTLHITAFYGALFAHLRPGTTWSSRAYDHEGL